MRKLAYKHWIAIIYITVLFLDRLDISIVNITLPTLAKHFHVPITQTDWISTSFLLALAISIPVSAWLGDKFGLKRMFLLATAIFGFASLLCAFAPNLLLMSVFRFLQGIGGGIIIPVGMTMLYRNFEPFEYASITSLVFLPSLLAPAIAPAIGGFIVQYIGWQWVFIFSAPLCLVAILLALFILHEDKRQNVPPLDILGFILIAVSLSLLLYAISIAGKQGFTALDNLYWLLALFGIIGFILHEQRTAHPLFDLSFFKNKLFVQANLIQLAFQICHFGSFFLISMYLQVGVGISPWITGLIIGMQALGAMCTIRYSVTLFQQFGSKLAILLGLSGVAVLSLAILWIRTPEQILAACILLFMRGIFSGLCGTPIQAMSIIDFDKQYIGKINAIFNACRQIAISLGIASFSLLIAFGLKNPYLNTQTLTAFYPAFFFIPIVCMLGMIVAWGIDNEKILSVVKQ